VPESNGPRGSSSTPSGSSPCDRTLTPGSAAKAPLYPGLFISVPSGDIGDRTLSLPSSAESRLRRGGRGRSQLRGGATSCCRNLQSNFPCCKGASSIRNARLSIWSHSSDHPPLRGSSPPDLRRELSKCPVFSVPSRNDPQKDASREKRKGSSTRGNASPGSEWLPSWPGRRSCSLLHTFCLKLASLP
jgi:hypothetical protein